jgi:hypothetical protein
VSRRFDLENLDRMLRASARLGPLTRRRLEAAMREMVAETSTTRRAAILLEMLHSLEPLEQDIGVALVVLELSKRLAYKQLADVEPSAC